MIYRSEQFRTFEHRPRHLQFRTSKQDHVTNRSSEQHVFYLEFLHTGHVIYNSELPSTGHVIYNYELFTHRPRYLQFRTSEHRPPSPQFRTCYTQTTLFTILNFREPGNVIYNSELVTHRPRYLEFRTYEHRPCYYNSKLSHTDHIIYNSELPSTSNVISAYRSDCTYT